jgi:ribosomal protein S18 acetylase RimI-like enzyme
METMEKTDTFDVKITMLAPEHIEQVARLHVRGINKGFISSLGETFVRRLYQAIVESERAFGFVAIVDGKVAGFVSCAESVGSVYKHVLKKHFVKCLWTILPKMLCPRNVKHALETLFYPKTISSGFPPAEILAVVVSEYARGAGIGKTLIRSSLDEFRKRKIPKVKVMVGCQLPANTFYAKLGFELAGQYQHHGYMLNVYVYRL